MDDVSFLIFGALAVVALFICVLALVERRRISRLFVKAGATGLEFSVEMHQLVQREVQRVSAEVLRRSVAIDRKMVEFWERENMHRHEDSAPKLKTLEDRVLELEQALTEAPATEKVQIAFVLRDAYWAYLKQARDHYASSVPYHEIRAKVFEGFERLEALHAA